MRLLAERSECDLTAVVSEAPAYLAAGWQALLVPLPQALGTAPPQLPLGWILPQHSWHTYFQAPSEIWVQHLVLALDDDVADADAALDALCAAGQQLRWSAEACGCEILLRWDPRRCTAGRICDLIEAINSPRIAWELPLGVLSEAEETHWIRTLDWRLGGVRCATPVVAEASRAALQRIRFAGSVLIRDPRPEACETVRNAFATVEESA